LHAVTEDPKHLALGRYFIDERGNPKGIEGLHYYDWEAKQRGERLYERPTYFPVRRSYWYQQAHLPIAEQESVEGHSVRAMYLLTGAADLQRKQHSKSAGGDKDYQEALQKLWRNMVDKKMYLTGGIGAMDQWEGFGIDYFLPQSTDEGGCYAETCAAIGAMMLAERLLQVSYFDWSIALADFPSQDRSRQPIRRCRGTLFLQRRIRWHVIGWQEVRVYKSACIL
jgi:DUF1680 family protein